MSEAPAKVEITPEQLAFYQRGMNLLNKLEGDPRSKPLIEQAVKIHHPEVVTEAETVERQVTPLMKPVQDALDKINERFTKADEAAAAADQARVEAKIDTDFATLAKQGYTAEGIEKVKALMMEEKLPSVFAAAALFEKNNPVAANEASSYQPQTWDLGSAHAGAGGDTKLLFENPDAWTDKQIPLLLNEIRGTGNR